MKKQTIVYISIAVLIVILGLAYIGYFSQTAKNNLGENEPAIIFAATISNTGFQSATAGLSSQKTISWQTSGYPEGVGVNINLLRETSDSPKEFSLVRIIATDTPNDGQEIWTPQPNENDNDLYVEITCSKNYQFKQGCQSGMPIKVN